MFHEGLLSEDNMCSEVSLVYFHSVKQLLDEQGSFGHKFN